MKLTPITPSISSIRRRTVCFEQFRYSCKSCLKCCVRRASRDEIYWLRHAYASALTLAMAEPQRKKLSERVTYEQLSAAKRTVAKQLSLLRLTSDRVYSRPIQRVVESFHPYAIVKWTDFLKCSLDSGNADASPTSHMGRVFHRCGHHLANRHHACARSAIFCL